MVWIELDRAIWALTFALCWTALGMFQAWSVASPITHLGSTGQLKVHDHPWSILHFLSSFSYPTPKERKEKS